MELNTHMVEMIGQLAKLKEEERRLFKLAYPDIEKEYPAKQEVSMDDALWYALFTYEGQIKRNIKELNKDINEKEQKNNSCSNTSI